MIARGHVLEVLAGASAALGLERDYINDLNVYPVPDGDTGTNLFLTVQAIIDETEAAPVDDLPGLMALVTRGSLMGARGNWASSCRRSCAAPASRSPPLRPSTPAP